MPVGSYFDLLGDGIERRWRERHGREADFPVIAAEALQEVELPSDVTAARILEHLNAAESLPQQEDPDATFGKPPVTLYRGRGFFIAALYWLDGTTSIHQHCFSGALRVLEGSSIHALYDFEVEERLDDRLRSGALVFRGAEHLRPGDVREIKVGQDFIHALFHLERPSVTIVVRTYQEQAGLPQFTYLRPGFAYDPFSTNESLSRRLQAMDTYWEIEPSEALRSVKELVRTSDLFTAFVISSHWFDVLERGEAFEELLEHLVRCHPQAALLPSVFEDRRRENQIVQRRRMLHDPGHRLLLALLLNLPDRDNILRLLAQARPGEDPVELIARWVGELASPALRGVSGIRMTESDAAALRTQLRTDGELGLGALASRLEDSPVLGKLLAVRG